MGLWLPPASFARLDAVQHWRRYALSNLRRECSWTMSPRRKRKCWWSAAASAAYSRPRRSSGKAAASSMSSSSTPITISSSSRLLPEVAASSIHSADAVVPLRQLLRRLQVRQAEVMGIDFDQKKVIVVQGDAPRPDRSPLRRARHRARHRRRSEAVPRPAGARAHHEGPRRRAPAPHPRDRLLWRRPT